MMSMTTAVIVDVPPSAGSSVGLADTRTLPTAAVPIATFAAVVPLADAPPELAVFVAVPFVVPALNVTMARPPLVWASGGCIEPMLVVKTISVPSCGGVPAASSTCATIWVVPFKGNAVAVTVRVMVEPDGASSGTF